MSVLDQYLERSQDIIGERTPEEEAYDREVVKWLERTGKIRRVQPVARANNEAVKSV